MSKRSLFAAMAAGIFASAMDPSPYYGGPSICHKVSKVPETKEELHDYMNVHKMTKDGRQFREFSINGKKVMAYSKKDAITRLKHMK